MKLRLAFFWLGLVSLLGSSRLLALDSPAGPGTGESNLITAPDGTIYLTWGGSGAQAGERALSFATLAPRAENWSEARVIVSSPQLMLNWADFPSLIVGTDGTLWAQWFQTNPGAEGHGYAGWIARSTDQGKTWSKPAALGHEFVSLAPLSGGRVLAVWLESLRHGGHGHSHQDTSAAGASAPSMQLSARLLDAQGIAQGEWVVDGDVCTCCQTTVSVLTHDRVFVAYRGHTAEEIRDNLGATFDGRTWGKPQRIHADTWKIAACPVNGPASAARGETLAVAWFTGAGGIAQVQAKYSRDGGATFGPALPIDLGQPSGRVDVVMLADQSAIVTWLENHADAKRAGIYARRIFPDQRTTPAQLIAPAGQSRAAGFPRVTVRNADELLVTWTEEGASGRVRVQAFAPPAADTATLPPASFKTP